MNLLLKTRKKSRMITLSEEDLVKLLDREYNRGKADGLKSKIREELDIPEDTDSKCNVNLKDISIANTYWTLLADSSM